MMKNFSRTLHKLASFACRKSYSLYEIDRQLRPYLNFQRGFFVEAGANDGMKQSNTLYYEKYFSWRGILIEPVPHLAKKCKMNRPKAIVENAALVPFGFQNKEIEMRYCGLMSLVKGAMKSESEELNHIQNGCKSQNIETYEFKAPVATLSSLLDKHSVSTIDFLSLDVEGYEIAALKGINFNMHRPKFMLIEARFREEVDSFLYPLYEVISELTHHDVLYKLR
jgi:FkbM family methyltransferase